MENPVSLSTSAWNKMKNSSSFKTRLHQMPGFVKTNAIFFFTDLKVIITFFFTITFITVLEIKNYKHCVKRVQMRVFFWSVFFCIRTEYKKIRIRKNSVLDIFHSVKELSIFTDSSIYKLGSRSEKNAFIFQTNCVTMDLVYFTKRVPGTSGKSATQTTWLRHEWTTSDTCATLVLHERHECDTSATQTTWVRHESKNLIFITTQVKTYFHPYISYMANERLQGEERFHSKN